MQHAPFGSSTADRVMNCPGSVALSAKSPEAPPSEYAAKGSAQHALIEHLLLEGGEPEEFIGAKFADVEIDQELADGVAVALKAAEELLGVYDGEQLIEQRLVIVPDEVFGTGDIVATTKDGTRALIADHKFGYMEVSAESAQLKFLAAAFLVDPAMAEISKDVEEFELVIIQPAFDPPTVKATATRAEIEVFLRSVKLAHSATKSPSADVRMGDWCKWCRAKVICPAQKKLFADLIDIKVHPDWSAVEIAGMIENCKQVEQLIKAVEERAKHELANGRPIPGWRLKPGATRLSWSQPNKETIAVLRGLGLKGDKAIQPITPAAAKKALKLEELPDDIVAKSTSAPSLARDTDAADAVLPAAAFAKAAALMKGNR
jgi:hypothetical protein